MKAGRRYPLRLGLGLILQLREEEAITWKSTRTRYGDFQNKGNQYLDNCTTNKKRN